MNRLAVTSLVCSLAGPFTRFIGAILGIVLGFAARRQIRGSEGAQRGTDLAIAGIIVGFAMITFAIVFAVVVFVAGYGGKCSPGLGC
jgi:hypothetical protein